MATTVDSNSESIGMESSSVKEISSRQVTPSLLLPQDYAKADELRQYSFIELSLPYEAQITLSLYDQAGQQVGTLLTDKTLPEGNHQLTFSPEIYSTTPSFYRLMVKGGTKVYVEVKRLL